ncbi:hypothetical protein ABEB36_012644 [Hypothenemus hampei]|uniref:Uncharacterized protein n=1 Tax=Hypothenemus hampei TaxID=57062 RepID=A0ABD1EBY3_HYPHA
MANFQVPFIKDAVIFLFGINDGSQNSRGFGGIRPRFNINSRSELGWRRSDIRAFNHNNESSDWTDNYEWEGRLHRLRDPAARSQLWKDDKKSIKSRQSVQQSKTSEESN